MMPKILIITGFLILVGSVVSLFPIAKIAMGNLDYYFFFIVFPLILISMTTIGVGILLNSMRAKKKANNNKQETINKEQ
ncbi:hypothetical protein AUK11_01750 [bacterium CG2_30_37_16]|nr:MAG: hypothetical protein AUK11_01750 [bacterium CG2_30_37_16]PIP30518.1 MAG: hypothetical protein COX25_04325 [bacterium (Candidatus Howlettbacteria) CG23_combo_of_CG06-09_8_20_14_all_37_9]PIX99434.1 MAG: hypothetical protein COZ22_02540 [bacterium (Candidatus Howlettbacteria) CG_4_10_14_3_um_filter_37_10]PJB07503.1 MAG: hypothetical protein CO123_00040 [bacterium (Candidatus Howlettbacteria) CG_4_9_14_3_um_filter_37_10]